LGFLLYDNPWSRVDTRQLRSVSRTSPDGHANEGATGDTGTPKAFQRQTLI